MLYEPKVHYFYCWQQAMSTLMCSCVDLYQTIVLHLFIKEYSIRYEHYTPLAVCSRCFYSHTCMHSYWMDHCNAIYVGSHLSQIRLFQSFEMLQLGSLLWYLLIPLLVLLLCTEIAQVCTATHSQWYSRMVSKSLIQKQCVFFRSSADTLYGPLKTHLSIQVGVGSSSELCWWGAI